MATPPATLQVRLQCTSVQHSRLATPTPDNPQATSEVRSFTFVAVPQEGQPTLNGQIYLNNVPATLFADVALDSEFTGVFTPLA